LINFDRTYFYLITLIIISFGVSFSYSSLKLENYSQPPTFGGSDQLDYNAMAYAFYKKSIPGIYITDEYKESFTNFSNLNNGYIKRVLEAKNNELRTYAYRPLLYPIVLGISYKIFGYDFAVARYLNVFLIILTSVMIFYIIKSYTNPFVAFLGALSFVIFPNVVKYSNLLLSEILVVFMTVLFSFLMLCSIRNYNSNLFSLLLGLSLGFLVLSKQIFLYISIPIIILLLYYYYKKNRNTIGYFIMPYLIIIFSWFSYNIGITADIDLKGGTSGWHDMPSAYSLGYINGENRFKIREDIFNNYEKLNNIKIKGDIERSIYGKKIFFEMIKEKDFLVNLPKFIAFKLNGDLSSNYYTYWILFILSLISYVYLYYKKSIDFFISSILIIVLGNIGIVSLTFFDSGRLISPVLPLFIILISIFINFILFKEKHESND